MYNRTAMDHFLKPRNVGELAGAARGTAENTECGDTALVTLTVEGGRVSQVKFLSKGCAGAIASCSATTELAAGKTVEEAGVIDLAAVDTHLGGLPAAKHGCIRMAVDALQAALRAARA